VKRSETYRRISNSARDVKAVPTSSTFPKATYATKVTVPVTSGSVA
jgi:hypothetical protein